MNLKKIVLSICITICSIIGTSGQGITDSCYVYGYLWWWPSATKYNAKIDLGPEKEALTDIMDANGTKLTFQSFINAVNYLSSEGWEIMEVSQKNPENNSYRLQQYAVIRKLMPLTEARKFASPQK